MTRVFGAFIDSADKPQGPLIYILTIEDPTYVAKALTMIATTSVGDAVLVRLSLVLCIKYLANCDKIYRLYIVWGRNMWICIPSIISYMGYVGKQRICSWHQRLLTTCILVASGIAASVLITEFSPAKPYLLPTITRWIQGGGIASLV